MTVHYEQLIKVAPPLRLPERKLREWRDQFSFEEFTAWTEQENLPWNITIQSERDINEAKWNWFTIARYVAAGERVFRVEAGLARLLLDTDVLDVTGDYFQLPFPAIYVEFPGQLFVIPGIDQVAIGCYLVDLRPIHHVIGIDFVIEPKEKVYPGIHEFCIHTNLHVGLGELVHWGNLVEEFTLSLLAIAPLAAAPEYGRMVAAFAEEIVKFLINTVLYATSGKPELTEAAARWRELERQRQKAKGKKRENLNRQLQKFPQTQKSLLGATIPIVYGAPRAIDFTAEAKTDRKFLKKFRVRGHWHWYLHGPGKTLRRHLYVATYWKGPGDLAEYLRRKYVLR